MKSVWPLLYFLVELLYFVQVWQACLLRAYDSWMTAKNTEPDRQEEVILACRRII